MSKKMQDNMPQGDFAFPREWTLFGPGGKDDPEPDFEGMKDIPKELTIAGKRLVGQKAVFTDNYLDLGALLGGREKGKTAYLLTMVTAERDMDVTFGAGADRWMKWWVNGEVVCDTTASGNGNHPPSVLDHSFTARFKAGHNLIAVKVVSGAGSFVLAAGSAHDMADIKSRVEIARRQWRESLTAVDKPMALIKEDWETVKTRCAHWWANELYDRALVMVMAPKQDVAGKIVPYPGAVTLETPWIDAEYLIWQKENEIRTTYYGGELTPFLFFNSPVAGPLFMGCEPKFTAESLWTEPLPAGADGYPPIRFHRESQYWRLISEGTRLAAQASRGAWYVHPSIDYAGDTLVGIRGVNDLMIDIVENPAWVRQAVKQLSGILIGISDELLKSIDEKITGLEGSIGGCGVWSPGRGAAIACDMAVNLSPEQFEDLFLPSLIEYMATVDYRCWHMDGYVQHLDLLLALPELQAIQWYPPDAFAPNGKGILPWIPLIKRIQRVGKAVQVYCKPEEIPALLGEVSARGLCICTTGACASEQEARDLVALVARLSRDR